MSDLNLDEEEIKKFKSLLLDPGMVDAVVALGFLFFFTWLLPVFNPPIFNIIKTNFMFIIAFFSLLLIPILLISIIDIVNNYKIIKNRSEETESKDYRLISTLSFYIIPLLFIIYFPTNILEFYLWIITALALYLGFGKLPLIKYSIELFHFPSNSLYFNKRVVRNLSPSVFCLNLAMWIVLLAITLRIYPIPFLLIFYSKYIIQRKYFHDLTSEDFYENWDRAERFLMNCFYIESLTVMIILAILFALAYVGYY